MSFIKLTTKPGACWAPSIRRIILLMFAKGRSFKKVLEVGAGDGSILQKLSDYNFGSEYHAVEISDSGVAHIRSRNIKDLVSVQEFDGYKLPFEDDSFDLVILSHVLEHVEHERLLLREIKRVSSNFVIEVPIDYKPNVDKRIKHFLAYGHINMYTPTSLGTYCKQKVSRSRKI
jgi:ubiquinone/menaquinone biosynthesis C-methylase UbiE